MKRAVLTLAIAAVMGLSFVSHVQASAFITIAVTGSPAVTCNNSSAVGVGLCTAAGFTTVLGGNSISAGALSVGGYTLGSLNLTGNQPGNALTAFVLDSKFNVNHVSGFVTDTLTIDFGGNDFSLPAGPGLFLSSSQAANWTQSTAGDSQAFRGWGRDDNQLNAGPGGATAVAITANCVSPGGLTASCASQSPDSNFNETTPFALTGQEIITTALGTTASYSGTVAANAQPQQVPEPTSLLLLGTSMLLLAGSRIRRRK